LQALDMDEELVEPNMEFVKQFDKFASYSKAAGFIEDWIRTKKIIKQTMLMTFLPFLSVENNCARFLLK